MMNRLWESEGCEITGNRILGQKFHGVILSTRVMYGTDIELCVKDLDTGETFLESGHAVRDGERNLVVYAN